MGITGSELVAKALKRHGFDAFFFIMGEPMYGVERSCISEGLRAIDVRHEQAGAMAAHAYARLLNKPGLCMAASGPGTTNLVTGLAHSLVDCVPVLALGGSSPISGAGRGVFQEFDQLSLMKPCTKWAERVSQTERIPEIIDMAVRQAMSGRRGPVYLDLPGDVLYREIDEATVRWPAQPWTSQAHERSGADPAAIARAVELLKAAKRPVIISGSGVLWADASRELRDFVGKAGIPFYTTPQGRGAVPEDDPMFFAGSRSMAFKDADLIFVIGTRMNYVINHAAPPRFNGEAKIVRIEVDPNEMARSTRLDLGLLGDAKIVLKQLVDAVSGAVSPEQFAAWRDVLDADNRGRAAKQEAALADESTPIHPMRLCKEVRDILKRDDVLVVDGQEILNYGRQAIPSFTPGHRLNSGTFGTMGVGMPFGIGAKVAKPGNRVVVLHGDGSFGLNAMEFDTAVRHHLPLLVVISLNGGWTADPKKEKPGRDLGYTRFDQMAAALGGHGEYVEEPGDLAAALRRALEAVDRGQPALVNVKTDWRARAGAAAFTAYST
ncbi:thiamine pyrophosphate-binding protein (plasmid) [Bosea sp. F3-2]|uniref:thiamine pyrophosphate-binding protein n=1 Tax=Bosea sp. F3-2 TaxID=2599640 RepID=UPI0011EEEB95|nr:thiamine pyrophosphate-binding protein [Bosea sp. F3-2]QEL27333.1 thiamine pyrophosphate-binding protein [Bosea sp. F3-2]